MRKSISLSRVVDAGLIVIDSEGDGVIVSKDYYRFLDELKKILYKNNSDLSKRITIRKPFKSLIPPVKKYYPENRLVVARGPISLDFHKLENYIYYEYNKRNEYPYRGKLVEWWK